MDFHGKVKNSDLAEVCMTANKADRKRMTFDRICQLLDVDVSSQPRHLEQHLQEVSRLFCLTFDRKWNASRRYRILFEQRFADWLNQEIDGSCPSGSSQDQHQRDGRGRPRKAFEDLSPYSKKRRVRDFVRATSPSDLQLAQLATEPNVPATSSSSLSVHKTIALWLDLDLSERKYILLRSVVNAVNKNFFPSLYAVKHTKNSLLPFSIHVSETVAEVDLGQLLKTTAESILRLVDPEEGDELTLICKWGLDGSGGHSQYKQVFAEEGSTDEYMLVTAMVPIMLQNSRTSAVLWKNERPSSTSYCRPIKFAFKKECATLVRSEEDYIQTKLRNLGHIQVTSPNGLQFRLDLDMHLTMIDGSVINVLSNTNATSNCYICGATPKEMNSSEVSARRQPNPEHYRYGLSILHCWIRFFECLLHIGYRLPVKVWQVRGTEHKALVAQEKARIQREFRATMGLLVDQPKQGFGSTNDGNTARRFFFSPEISARITKIDERLIKNFSIILRVLASGQSINKEKFRDLLNQTKGLYLELYPWYYMPSTVHKVLVHGVEVIDSFQLPIGVLSEDALEALHKEVRRNRLSHTRKFSRTSSNKDLMRMLLLNSDPFLASLRTPKIKKQYHIDAEVSSYLNQLETFPIADFDVSLLDVESDDESE